MVILNDKLKVEIERLKHEQGSTDETKIQIENSKMRRKLEICDNVIDELKTDLHKSSKLNEELKDNMKTTDFLEKETNADIKKKLLDASEENLHLEKKIDKLCIQVKDQNEEIDGKSLLIAELNKNSERKDSSMTYSSCGSLADEINFANHKLERDKLQEEVESMKVKIEHFEKNAKNRSEQLEKLSELSISRNETLSKLKSSLNNVKKRIKPNCKFRWKCKRGRMCTFNHVYLYSKVNKTAEIFSLPQFHCQVCAQTFKSKDLLEEHIIECLNPCEVINPLQEEEPTNYECAECKVIFTTSKKLRKHRKHAHKVGCELCGKFFASKINFEEHVESEHIKENVEENKNVKKESGTKICVLEKTIAQNNDEDANKLENKETTTHSSNQEIQKDSVDYRNWNEFECELCKKDFNNIQDLDSHMDHQHATKINCGICKLDFKCIKDMNVHMDM